MRKELEREIYVIDGMIKKYNPGAIEDIFDRSSPGRQVLINPIFMPDEMFAQIWSDEEYEGLPLIDDAASFITKRGEKSSIEDGDDNSKQVKRRRDNV